MDQPPPTDNDQLVVDFVRTQIERFAGGDSQCRALELPEGLMLRYRMSRALYFYLRTGVKDGKISTLIFATDSPYDRQKSLVGEVTTPMFADQANAHHLDRIQKLLYSWVDFVRDETDAEQGFATFEVKEQRG